MAEEILVGRSRCPARDPRVDPSWQTRVGAAFDFGKKNYKSSSYRWIQTAKFPTTRAAARDIFSLKFRVNQSHVWLVRLSSHEP